MTREGPRPCWIAQRSLVPQLMRAVATRAQPLRMSRMAPCGSARPAALLAVGFAAGVGASGLALLAARAHWRRALRRHDSRSQCSAAAGDDTWFRKPKKAAPAGAARPPPPPPAVFDGVYATQSPSSAAWTEWDTTLRAACAASAPEARTKLLRQAAEAVLRHCGDECASVAVVAPRERTSVEVAHVWVLPSRRAQAAPGNALLSLMLEAAPQASAATAAAPHASDAAAKSSSAMNLVERHVRARAAALVDAARGNAAAARAAACAADVRDGYDEESDPRARVQMVPGKLAWWYPAFGALISGDGATIRFCRYDGAAADPEAPPRWTPPLPLRHLSSPNEFLARESTPPAYSTEGFRRLFALLYTEPSELGQRLRVPGLLARLLADEGEGDDDMARFGTAQELKDDASQLRDPAWLLGHGQRTRAYLLPASLRRRHFPGERGAAVALVAMPSQRLPVHMPERLVLEAPAFARRSDAPRLLHACHASSLLTGGVREGPCFAVFAPAGVPLASLCAHPGWAARLADVAARRQLAETVAASLLAMLRAAHRESRLAHTAVLPEHVIMLPPTDDDAAWADAEDVAALAAALLEAPQAQLRAALVSWRSATPVGKSKGIAWQYGYGPDALEELTYNYTGYSVRFVRATEAWDCECVAYIYAAIVHGAAVLGGDYAPPPWAIERVASDGPDQQEWLALLVAGNVEQRDDLPPWTYWAESKAAEADRNAHNDAVRARGGTDAELLGRLAWRRTAWLREHPHVLGDRGARFLEHARAGRAVYSLDISEEEHAALLAVPPAPID